MKYALIGDIHGYLEPLEEILKLATKRPSMLIFLGDYVNRGPETREVIDLLVTLKANPRIETSFLRGNHDTEFLKVLQGGGVDNLLRMGGARTVRSYVERPYGDVAAQLRDAVPIEHYEFFDTLRPAFKAEGLEVMHEPPKNERSAYVVAAHSPRADLVPDIGASSAFIDTGCGTLEGGRLTCLFWPSLQWVQSAPVAYTD